MANLLSPTTMASQNLPLPLDIISEVVGHLDFDTDMLALRALSTTCYALLEPSQRKLFNKLKIPSVSLSNHNVLPTYSALNNLFNVSPHLATYVRHLAITLGNPYPDISILFSIIVKMCSMQRLEIIDLFAPWNKYPEMDPQWRESVSAVLCHPSLQ